MEQSFILTILVAIVLVAGISAQVVANIVKIPSIVFLLAFGVLLGPDGLGIVRPQLLGVGLEVIVSLAVALILFEGGLNLNLSTLGRVSKSLWRLVTLGASITLLGGAIAAHYLSEFPWPIAFVYASLVVVTGPTVVTPILKRVRVGEALSTLLEGEGVLIDPIGAILAVVVLNLVLAGKLLNPGELALAAGHLVASLSLGALIGAAGGWGIGQVLRRFRRFFSEELTNSVVLAAALGIYTLAQSLLSESGLMAAVAAGMAIRQVADMKERQVRRFQGQLVLLAISVLFVLLTANLSLKSIGALGWGSVGTVVVLMLVVRPLSIWVCTLGSELNWQEKVFAAWLAPRGIVAASVSSLFALVLTERNVTGGEAVKALVFLTIALTVILQGLSAAWLARWLELKSGGVTVIVGDNIVGRQLAEFLRDRAQAVALIHHVPSASENLASENLATSPTLDFEQEGSNEFEPTEILTTIVGNALDESVLLQAHLERADRLVVLTENAEVNQAIAELALKTYDPPHIVAALNPEVSASEEIETIPFSCATLEQWMTSVPPEGVQVKPLQLPLQDAANEPECTVRLVVSDRPSVYPAPEVNSSLNDLRTPPTVSANDFMRLMDDLGDRSQSAQLLPLSLRRKQGYLLFPDVGQWQPGDEIAFLERTSSQVTLVYKPHKGNTRPADIPGTPPLHASPRNRFAWQFAPEQ